MSSPVEADIELLQALATQLGNAVEYCVSVNPIVLMLTKDETALLHTAATNEAKRLERVIQGDLPDEPEPHAS